MQLKLQSIIAAEQQNEAVMLALFTSARMETDLSSLIRKKLGEFYTRSLFSALAKVLKRAHEASECHKFVTNCKNAGGARRSNAAVTAWLHLRAARLFGGLNDDGGSEKAHEIFN